jgi:hypothetical protein
MVCNSTWLAINLQALTLNGITQRITAASVCQDISLLCYSSSSIHSPPFKHLPIAYSTKAQLTPVPETSELLDANCKHCIQEIVAALLYYARAVDNKLLVAISAISTCQSNATIATEQAVNLLLNYVATYPNDGIAY